MFLAAPSVSSTTATQSTNPPTQLFNMPEGAAGTRFTLKLMGKIVRDSRILQSVRTLAASLAQDLDGQNYTEEVRRCFEFVRDTIRYLQDTNGVELIQTPDVTLNIQAGDCDDKCTLLAALLESIGHPCRFIAVGYEAPNSYEHVYLETKVANRWIPLDPTQQVDIDWAPMPPWTNDHVYAVMKEHV